MKNFFNQFRKKQKNGVQSSESIEFQKSQDEFSKSIKNNGDGIEAELVNMRFVTYVSGGNEAVEKFDNRFKNSFGTYQSYLMGLSDLEIKQ